MEGALDANKEQLTPSILLARRVDMWIFNILHFSPIPGNIYKSDCFFCDCMADISQGDFMTVLAFALVHGHLAVVHECPNLQAFQVFHPSAIVHPLLEVPPAILAWSRFLLSRGIALAPLAAAPAPAPPAAKQFGILPAPSSSVAPNNASNESWASSSLLTSWSIGSPNANQGGIHSL